MTAGILILGYICEMSFNTDLSYTFGISKNAFHRAEVDVYFAGKKNVTDYSKLPLTDTVLSGAPCVIQIPVNVLTMLIYAIITIHKLLSHDLDVYGKVP